MRFRYGDSQAVFVRIKAGRSGIIVGSVYRPSERTPADLVQQYSENLIRLLKNVMTQFPGDTFLIGGDFNLPDINWNVMGIRSGQYTQKLNNGWIQLSSEQGLIQWVNFPTRETNILDLFFTNRPHSDTRCEPIRPGLSDHDIVLIHHPIDSPSIASVVNGRMRAERLIRDFSSRFYNRHNNRNSSVDVMWTEIVAFMSDFLERFIPRNAHLVRPVWMLDRKVRKESRKKQNWFHRYNYTGQPRDFSIYNSVKATYQQCRIQAYQEYIDEIFPDVPDNLSNDTDGISKIINGMTKFYDMGQDYYIVKFFQAHSLAFATVLKLLCDSCTYHQRIPSSWSNLYAKPVIRTGVPNLNHASYCLVTFEAICDQIIKSFPN